jgi:hypothetical protein
VTVWFAANDLWFTNGQHIRLSPPAALQTMQGERLGDSNVRIVDAPSFPKISEIQLRYSSLVPIAIQNRWTSVVTNEGGVQAASTSRLNSAIIKNTLPALATASANWVRIGRPWESLTGTLPRARFIPRESSGLCSVPIESITAEEVKHVGDVSLPCNIELDNGSCLIVSVQSPTDGTFVLADTFYPGWTCRRGDAELEIIPIHGVFRGVSLPAGPHRLVFEYEPWSFQLGLALSIFGILLIGGIVLHGYRAGRSTDRDDHSL